MTATRRAFLAGAAGSVITRGQRRHSRPNILLLFPDQLRYDWTGFNKNLPVRTPNLDWLAGRGMRFTNAVVASPLCAPSRACLASGKEYDRCRVASNAVDYPVDQITYYSMLRESGYHVAACGKIDLHKATADWGLDGKRLIKEWGFSDGIDNAGKFDAVRSGAAEPKDPYMAYLHQRGLAAAHVMDFRKRAAEGYQATYVTPLDNQAYCDNWLANNGLSLMRQFPEGRPWHLVVNFTGPHNPMDITSSMEKEVRGRRFPQPNRCEQYDADTHVAIRQNYTAMVENIDRWMGIFIEELKRRGELDNTVIVFSSDHGEMLGDHTRWGKTLPYQASAGVPLVIAGPRIESEAVYKGPATILDLAATFLDYADVKPGAEMDSRSMRPLLEGRTRKHRDVVRSGFGSWRMAFDGRYKLIRGFDPARRKAAESTADVPALLYDLTEDPLENTTVAARYPRHVERLSRWLESAR